MEYLVNGRKFSFSYNEVRDHYITFCEMSDEEFRSKLVSALHLACFICFVKEIPTYVCLIDDGLIHELVHLMDNPDCPLTDLQTVRELFKNQLKLA